MEKNTKLPAQSWVVTLNHGNYNKIHAGFIQPTNQRQFYIWNWQESNLTLDPKHKNITDILCKVAMLCIYLCL